MINQIGEHSLVYAPLQFGNLWQFNIIDINPLDVSSLTNTLDSVSQVMIPSFLVRNITLPFIKLEIESKSSGRKVYNAVNHVEPFSITFLELEMFPSLKFLSDWFEKVYDPVNNVFKTGLQNAPTKMGILTIYSALIPDLPSQIFVYEGLRISGIQNIDFTYDNTDPVTVTADFVCDKVYPLSNVIENKFSGIISSAKNKINSLIK